MESLSRPLHRRKLSNANSFSAKNAYDGVFSGGHRRNYDRPPAVNVEEYSEIFSSGQVNSSIPVLDLSTLEESSDATNLELGSTKPDYGKIFGGFRDQDIAVSYEELFARDKARAPSSTSQSSQDLCDLSHQSSDALKQFNMSYNKITQRSKDGLDAKTHVTQLHAVSGFTCFIDESASQPKKETEKQKASVTNNIHPIPTSKEDIPKKETSQSVVGSRTKFCQDESLSDDIKLSVTNNGHSSKGDFPEKQTAGNAVESRSKYHQVESVSDDKISKKIQDDIKIHPFKVSSSPAAASAANVDNNHMDYQNISMATNTGRFGTCKSDIPGGFSSTCFDEELDVNSVAAASAAALRKAIEKAQESIRIAKESVGRKKEGLRSFSNKSFKDSLKVKTRVANVRPGEDQKEIGRNHKHGDTIVFPDFADGEKLFGAKKVIDEMHGKISESSKNSEIPIRSFHRLVDDKTVCNSKEVAGETEAVEAESSESVESNTFDASQEDNQTPNGFLVFESFENKLEDTEDTIKDDKPCELENNYEVRPSNVDKLAEGLSNLALYEKVEEDEKKISQGSDQNGYEKRFSEEALELLENKKQEFLEQEASEKVVEDERELKEDGEIENLKEEDMSEKFYDVCEVEMIENAQTYAKSLENTKVSSKDDCEMKEKESEKGEEARNKLDKVHELEIYENSSSDYDDAEETENNVESSQEVDDVSSNSAEVIGTFHEFQVEDTEAIEGNEIFERISEDNEDECEAKSESLLYCRLAEQTDVQSESQSESSSDTIHGMELEVNEYKEREEDIVSSDEKERTEEPKASTELEEKKDMNENIIRKKDEEVNLEERERERNRLVVERAIREARERAFIEARERAERAAVEKATAEVRQRVMADAQEKAAKASVGIKAYDKTSAQSKLRAERAAVERATSEARQRALEKAMSQKKTSEPIGQTSYSDTHVSNGGSAESAQRTKAKLEKHNRIMERAAKALAEKEKRDLLAQKEQAERNRLAENLDADIKRWSNGKEGNLRALLSTLQYILGAESGWQPISLTEIITSSAVKKAYRKATLCVHPDKLQQRGATIQQKYICEKVFDLLKAAWNRFNSEER